MKNKFPIAVLFLALAVGCTTQKITPAKPATPTEPATPAVTNYIVDPRLDSTLGTIGEINKATAPINPFSPLVDIGLGAAALIAAWVAKRKNDQAAQSALLFKTVVQGVENAANPTVKAAIQAHAGVIGVEGELGTAVQKINNGSL
tara:strand:+ start:1145 stop:1582 length:438 start_codon:yes stop_codon:yes gene_type:complete